MPSRFPVVPLFGALIHLARYEPQAAAAREALLSALRRLLGDAPLAFTAKRDLLLLDGETVPLAVPGATLLHEQFLLHGIAALEIAAGATEEDLLALATVLGAFPGQFGSHQEVVAALGASAARLRLTPLASQLGMYALSRRGRHNTASERSLGSEPLGIQREDAETMRFAAPAHEGDAGRLSGGTVPDARLPLGSILERGRRAVAAEDWDGLLDAAVQLIHAEDEAASDRTGEAYRLELKRLVSREHFGMIARLAQGERKQEAIGLLRRLGPVATETLVDLLVESDNLGERRSYYAAITQMGEGSEAIIEQLDHPIWYVIRNAAELSGDMRLTGAVPALGRQMLHPDERVRKSVAGALARIATPQALPLLGKMLGDPATAVRRQALAQVAGARMRVLCTGISALLQREGDSEVQREALFALGRIGSDEALTVLEIWAGTDTHRLGRKPLPLRLLAVKGLALAGPAAVNVLSTLTRDETPEIRVAAGEALAVMRPA